VRHTGESGLRRCVRSASMLCEQAGKRRNTESRGTSAKEMSARLEKVYSVHIHSLVTVTSMLRITPAAVA